MNLLFIVLTSRKLLCADNERLWCVSGISIGFAVR